MKIESRPAWSDRETFTQIYSQRSGYRVMTIVIVLLLIMIAGCAGGAGVDTSNADTDDGGAGGGDIAPSANETEKQALAETHSTTAIPQPETLDSTLHELVIAENQTTFAQQRDLDLRNDTVLVTIVTDSDDQLPTSITTDIKARSGNEILAYVAVNDLIVLAQNDTIRTVRVPKTGNADTNQPNQPTSIRMKPPH